MMNCLIKFSQAVIDSQLPAVFPSPFNLQPHPVAQRAAQQLQQTLNSSFMEHYDFSMPNAGKMFGVLVVKTEQGELGFLAAFAGIINQQWYVPGFAPPVFDVAVYEEKLSYAENELNDISAAIASLHNNQSRLNLQRQFEDLSAEYVVQYERLKQQHKIKKAARRQLRAQVDSPISIKQKQILLGFESQQDRLEMKAFKKNWCTRLDYVQAQQQKFETQLEVLGKAYRQQQNRLRDQLWGTYRLQSSQGDFLTVPELFADDKPLPGTGDCAAIKLLHFANTYHLQPIALAEFWWGAQPIDEVRHHGFYYPCCRGKCRPLLPYLLKGLAVQPEPVYGMTKFILNVPETIYEDEELLVVNKPAGMLSVPGSTVTDCVYSRIRQRYPYATGPLLVHRLDLATSGLLLIAKNLHTHKALQRQFAKRLVEKRYEALLEQSPVERLGDRGTVDLPLRVDLDDRPRQRICVDHGKKALTHWRLLSTEQNVTRVYFYPVTGRTHQLRIHAAHQL